MPVLSRYRGKHSPTWFVMTLLKTGRQFFRTIALRGVSSEAHKLCSPFLVERGFIDGQWVSPIINKRFDVVSPADNKPIGKVSDFDSRDAEMAIDAATKAFETWSRTSPRERSSLLRKLNDLLLKNIDALATLISLEMGKPIKESKGEIVYGASFLEWFAEQAKRINGEIFSSPFSNSLTMFTREPAGVVGIITPVRNEVDAIDRSDLGHLLTFVLLIFSGIFRMP